MERKWKTLNRKLQRRFYLRHKKSRLMKSFVKASIVFNIIVTGFVSYLSIGFIYVMLSVLFCEMLALGAVQRRINLLHRRTLKSNKLYKIYENETRRMLLEMYYNYKINRNIYSGYFVFKKAEQSKVELNNFMIGNKERRKYLERKAKAILKNSERNVI